jgi:hypothetical protein
VVSHHDVVEDRQLEHEARALEGAGDPGAVDGLRREVGDRVAAEGHLAPVRGVDAGHDVEERGLARAVGPDQTQYLVAPGLEVEALQGDQPTEALGEAAGGQEVLGGRAHFGCHPGT